MISLRVALTISHSANSWQQCEGHGLVSHGNGTSTFTTILQIWPELMQMLFGKSGRVPGDAQASKL